jgi:MoaA/NifB/PqqE/SkfB family radical SAM enzyme
MYGDFFQKNYLTLILTLRCNLNCFFCPIKKRSKTLNFEVAKKGIDFFLSLENHQKTIKFFGGEPFLEFNLLKKIILYAELKSRELNKKIKFLITTNGILLKDTIISFLEDHNIELTLSSHHFKKINKKRNYQIINFSKNSLTIDVPPEKAKNLYTEFIEFYNLGFRGFNLLPVYYVYWSQQNLNIFAQNLKKIKDFYSTHQNIYFLNSELIGEVPLFNSCYNIDPWGNIYTSNIILFKKFEKFKNLLFIGNVKKNKLKKPLNTESLREIIEEKLSPKIIKPTFMVDKILNEFTKSLKLFKKADIKVGYSCNNHCKFCVQGRKRENLPDLTTKEIKKILKKAKEDCRGIIFTGGEASIRSDFLELANYAKSLEFDQIQVQTNGRMFAYKKFCEEVIAAGINEFGLALHGHIPQLHNYLTASESFYQVIQGIKNLKELGQVVLANTVITKSNYRHLPEIAKLLVFLGVDQFQFAFVHALGSAKENSLSIVPRMSMVIPYVKKGLDIGIKTGIKVMTEAIPYCLLDEYKDYAAENIIPSTKIFDLDEGIIDFDKVRPMKAKAKGENCKECRYFTSCEGNWREYPQKFGWGEFKPIK